jgi:hypothetical protein
MKMKKELRLLALLGLTASLFVGCGKPQDDPTSMEDPTAMEATSMEDPTAMEASPMEEPQEMTETNWQPELSQPKEDQGHVHGVNGHSH